MRTWAQTAVVVVASVALMASGCADDGAEVDRADDAEERAGTAADDSGGSALGCAGELDGRDTCTFTAPADADGLELWVWIVGTGAVTDRSPSTTGGCVADNGTCLGVGAVIAGGEVACEADGTGSWGCAVQPGGPIPPAEITELVRQQAECQDALAEQQAEFEREQAAYQRELAEFDRQMAERGATDPIPSRPFPPARIPPPGC